MNEINELHGTRAPTTGKGVDFEMRGDSKTKKTPISTVAFAQKQMRDWWRRGTDLRRRVEDWVVTSLSATKIKKPTTGQEKVPESREEESVDIANVVWSEVNGMRRFLMGVAKNGVCVVGVLTKILTQTRTRATIHQKCGPGAQPEFLRRWNWRLCHADG